MPQIGWFEILIVVVLAILIIGPKDFPLVVRKIGNWLGTRKRYFGEIQKDVSDMGNAVKDEVTIDEDLSNIIEDKKKDE